MHCNQERLDREQRHFDTLVDATGVTWWGNTTAAGRKRLHRRAQVLAARLACFQQPNVLELGCGVGEFSRFLLEEIPRLVLTCCDISPQAIQKAQELYGTCNNACFEVADATSLHYEADVFDAVVGRAILHHLPLESTLKECFRVLKPGGIFWFSEPNMLNPQIVLEKHVPFLRKLTQTTDDETAFFRWALARTLREIGFYEISVEPFDFLHPFIPEPLIGIVERIGGLLEKIPGIREIAGSLNIYARKPIGQFYDGGDVA